MICNISIAGLFSRSLFKSLTPVAWIAYAGIFDLVYFTELCPARGCVSGVQHANAQRIASAGVPVHARMTCARIRAAHQSSARRAAACSMRAAAVAAAKRPLQSLEAVAVLATSRNPSRFACRRPATTLSTRLWLPHKSRLPLQQWQPHKNPPNFLKPTLT